MSRSVCQPRRSPLSILIWPASWPPRVMSTVTSLPVAACTRRRPARLYTAMRRSEEHTSELQSQSNLVCRLLLEKKKRAHRAEDITTVDVVLDRRGHGIGPERDPPRLGGGGSGQHQCEQDAGEPPSRTVPPAPARQRGENLPAPGPRLRAGARREGRAAPPQGTPRTGTGRAASAGSRRSARSTGG